MFMGSACLHSEVALAATPNPMGRSAMLCTITPWYLFEEKVRRAKQKVDILGGVFCDSAQPTLHDVVTIQELLLCRSLHPNLR